MAPLKIRNEVYIFDSHLQAGDKIEVPTMDGFTPLLYVMDGEIKLGEEVFSKRDMVTDVDVGLPSIIATARTTVVLFLVNQDAKATTQGLFNGIQR